MGCKVQESERRKYFARVETNLGTAADAAGAGDSGASKPILI